jgi:deoxyribonucleoside regulator
MEHELLVKVAKFYYLDQYTQSQIAKKIGVERSTVSRLLKKSREEGIVKISIDEGHSKQAVIAEKLREKYSLKDLIIVKSGSEMSEEINEKAHQYLQKVTSKNEIVGITWGKTLCDFSKYKLEIKNKKLNFIALTGGYGNLKEYTHINAMINNLSEMYNGRGYFIDFPLIMNSEPVKEEVYNSRFFRNINNIWSKLQTVVVGIGTFEKDINVLWESGLPAPKNMWSLLKSEEPVGEICTRFYDSNGKIIKTEIDKRKIGIEIERFKDMKNVIGIAVGNKKVNAIKTAIKSNFINVLITDEKTGQSLLEA